MPYRIQRLETQSAIVFSLSGELDAQLAAELAELLGSETHARILLDLTEITFVDRAGIRFLAGVESPRVLAVNGPEYVRSWVAAEVDEMHSRVREV